LSVPADYPPQCCWHRHPGHADRQRVAHRDRAAVSIRDGRPASRLCIQPRHQHSLGIGELQAFDMQQGVGTVATRYGIGHRPDIVRQIGRAAGVMSHRILGLSPEKMAVSKAAPPVEVPGRISRTALSWPGL
jgi:hypothetical protein